MADVAVVAPVVDLTLESLDDRVRALEGAWLAEREMLRTEVRETIERTMGAFRLFDQQSRAGQFATVNGRIDRLRGSVEAMDRAQGEILRLLRKPDTTRRKPKSKAT